MEKNLTKKKLRQELIRLQIENCNIFFLAFDNFNDNERLEGWCSFRFNKELFIKDKERWSFLKKKLPSNIRIFYPQNSNIKAEEDLIKITKKEKLIPILVYNNGKFFFKDQINIFQEKETLNKMFQYFSFFKKFYNILKVHSAIIKI
jgi:hypothetical protein